MEGIKIIHTLIESANLTWCCAGTELLCWSSAVQNIWHGYIADLVTGLAVYLLCAGLVLPAQAHAKGVML